MFEAQIGIELGAKRRSIAGIGQFKPVRCTAPIDRQWHSVNGDRIATDRMSGRSRMSGRRRWLADQSPTPSHPAALLRGNSAAHSLLGRPDKGISVGEDQLTDTEMVIPGRIDLVIFFPSGRDNFDHETRHAVLRSPDLPATGHGLVGTGWIVEEIYVRRDLNVGFAVDPGEEVVAGHQDRRPAALPGQDLQRGLQHVNDLTLFPTLPHILFLGQIPRRPVDGAIASAQSLERMGANAMHWYGSLGNSNDHTLYSNMWVPTSKVSISFIYPDKFFSH